MSFGVAGGLVGHRGVRADRFRATPLEMMSGIHKPFVGAWPAHGRLGLIFRELRAEDGANVKPATCPSPNDSLARRRVRRATRGSRTHPGGMKRMVARLRPRRDYVSPRYSRTPSPHVTP